MDWLYDQRTDCWSVQTTLKIGTYLHLIRDAHTSQGALSGQRDVLTTTTAKRIRNRMVADLKLGAVLPPVVIGAVVDEARFTSLPIDSENIEEILPPGDERTLSIIDGMQRTAAVLEAEAEDGSVAEHKIRVEFWLARNVRSMIYRMLVLNTGQVPWTISRQLSVVFSPLIQEVVASVPELDKVSSPDRPGRRVAAAQYSTDAIVELYIAFSLRKTVVDTKEAVSDEFSRLDFVDNLSNAEFQAHFYSVLSMLARLDKAFSRYDSGEQGRMTKGRNIFDSQPARIGFVTSVGAFCLGRPGANRTPEDTTKRLEMLQDQLDGLLARVDALSIEQLGDFLKLDVLAEVLDRRVGQVGRYERAVYAEAFKVLIDESFEIDTLEPCWRAN